ncbi:MAG: hypothetical protein HY319_22280 [Armatimonadetes bacterium]|nr:hypothetical protein [Armatimonadota bacterium]
MIVCLVCEHTNQPGVGQCTHCGAALPRILQPTSVDQFEKRTSRYNQFREAGQKAKEGKWSPEEYADWLQNISRLLAQKARYLIDLYHSTGYYEYGAEEVEMGITGIQDYEQAMETMWEFIEDGDPRHIERGLELMWEGNEKINEAMRLNREFRRRLEDEWGYM